MSLLTRRRRGKTKQIKISLETLRTWEKGVYSYDPDRIPFEGLRSVMNVQLDQNGTLTPRPGLKLYGTQPTGTVIGQVYEFVKINTAVTPNVPESWMIWLENVGGVGYVKVSKDGGAHTTVTGKTYSVTDVKPHFEQVFGVVLIMNGVDNLSYMTIDTLTITEFSALTTPTGVSATPTGISGSTYKLRYRVTAANQGETAASTAVEADVSKLREVWNGTGEYVTFTWNRVTGADRYNIYVGDQAGFEYYLDTVVDNGSGSTQDYVDTGSIATTATRVAPVGDSTSGPKTTRATNVKGQPYMVGDTENLGRIWFGGNGESALDFSSFGGGGWVEPNRGGKDFPVVVKPFRDGKGTPMAVCFSKGTNGSGKRYLLQPQTTTVGDTIITFMSVQEDNGQDGTDSPDGVAMVNDAAYYPSRNGFKTTTTRASIQNILSTRGISDNIQENIENLSAKDMENCVHVVHDQRIYWALPYSSTTNNEIWVLDLSQKGAWMRPWNVAAEWLWLYADNTDGKSKMLGLVDNQFVEFDDAINTNDNGTAFQTSILSGDIKFGENGESASVIDVTFVFLRPQGNIDLSVNANTEDGLIPFADTMQSSASQAVSAHGRYGWGIGGWGGMATSLLSVAASKPRRKHKIEVDEECDRITWGVSSTKSGVDYQLSEVIIRYVPIGYIETDNET